LVICWLFLELKNYDLKLEVWGGVLTFWSKSMWSRG